MLLPRTTHRRLQLLLTTLRHCWRRVLLLLLFFWLFTLYTNRKHPFRTHPHSITHADIEFEIVHPPTSAIDTNGFLPLPSAKSLCSSHHLPLFKKRNTRRKIYDLVMVNGELDWLEIRLSTMEAHVDTFVIVESEISFTGLRKELLVRKNWARFERWEKKIVYHVLENMPVDVERTWDREDFQRNSMFDQVLPRLEGEKAPRVGDVIIVADADEVVRPAALLVLRNCDIPQRVTLRSQFYYYGFQWRHRGEEWAHPQATTYEGANTIRPVDLRNGEGGTPWGAWWEKVDLWNAGWHCSSCFATVDEMLNKMASFSHTGLNQEVFRDKMRIVDTVRKGKDLWDREGQVYDRIEGNWDLPEPLTRAAEKDRFAYMLDRDGPNAGFTDMGPSEVTAE